MPIDPAAPAVVEKRTIADLADWPYPKQQLVPLTEVVHDRLNVEVFRGCTRGCRFCQAGMITRPVRERPAEQVASMVQQGLRRTGYDEVALTSLSTADFSGIEDVVTTAMDDSVGCGNVSVSLPSLRVDAFTVGVAAQIQKARRTGLTFAPEAGTWRMRQVINKLITEEDLYSAVDSAFSQGWRRVKLYFLTGLPTETDEDTLGIVELARRCVELAKANGHNGTVTVSVGGFVPKAFTPFQWFGMNTEVELRRKVNLLRDAARQAKGVQIKWHDPRASLVEGLVSRGDRRLGPVIEHVWRAGGTFQEWSEHFRLDLWEEAMAAAGLDMDWYCHRHRTEDEVLPWDHLSAGLHKDFLWQDWRDALEELGLEDCRWTPCYDCGACTGYGIEHVVASAVPPAGGQPGHRPGPPAAAARCPSRSCRASRSGSAHEAARAVHQARQGALPVPPRRRPGLGAGAATLRACGSPTARASRPGRASASGSPCPPATRASASTSTSTWPTRSTPPSCPAHRHPVPAARAWRPRSPSRSRRAPTPSSRRSPAPRGGSSCPAVDPGALADAVERVLALDELPITVERKGTEATLDARPAILDLAPDGSVLDAELATQPRSLRPAELLRAVDPDLGRRPGASNSPMDVGRRRPLRADPLRGPRRTWRDVGPARGSACVMRRDLPDDRTPHRRQRRRHHPRAGAAVRRLSRPTTGPPAAPVASTAGDRRDSSTGADAAAKRRRRGSRGGRNRSRPRPDGAGRRGRRRRGRRRRRRPQPRAAGHATGGAAQDRRDRGRLAGPTAGRRGGASPADRRLHARAHRTAASSGPRLVARRG